MKDKPKATTSWYNNAPTIRYSEGLIDGSQIARIDDDMLSRLVDESELTILNIKNQLEEAELYKEVTPIDTDWYRSAKTAFNHVKYQKLFLTFEVKRRKSSVKVTQEDIAREFFYLASKQLESDVFHHLLTQATDRVNSKTAAEILSSAEGALGL